MKKGTVLNSEISSVISRLGHTDTLVVCDAGLPIPNSTARIDMALTQGVPSFMQVVDVVTRESRLRRRFLQRKSNNRIRSSTKRCSLTLSNCSNTRETP